MEKADFPIAMLCRVLGVSRSGYYRWKSAPPSERSTTDAKLKPMIAAIFAENHERGARKLEIEGTLR